MKVHLNCIAFGNSKWPWWSVYKTKWPIIVFYFYISLRCHCKHVGSCLLIWHGLTTFLTIIIGWFQLVMAKLWPTMMNFMSLINTFVHKRWDASKLAISNFSLSSNVKQSNLTNHYFSCILAVASTDAWWSRELRTDVRGVGRRVFSRTKGVVKSEEKDFFKTRKRSSSRKENLR